MEYISFDEFKKLDIYEDFIRVNPDLGVLKIEAFTANEGIPIPDTDIVIYKDIGEYNVVFFKGKTDSNGMIDNIYLPTPKKSDSMSLEIPLYTVYEMNAFHIGYETIKKYSIGMFGDVKVIQYVKMMPEVIIEDTYD
ncbi:MAG: hypothetical protein IJ463_01070 [Bacilli bacterium]|nr:hypothetical protein [Bacilli bacterium]